MPAKDQSKTNRFLFSTGSRAEFQFGFSRAVRHGPIVRVAGTAGIGAHGQVVSSDVVDQMRAALATMKQALEELGCTLEDVIMTRIYVKNAFDIDHVAVVHGEAFRDIRPATTIVRVGEFSDPKVLVEIEAEAVYGGPDDKK
jgi:enamine deaminase RidA (YjgF/YER057c/UK114 family)